MINLPIPPDDDVANRIHNDFGVLEFLLSALDMHLKHPIRSGPCTPVNQLIINKILKFHPKNH